LNPNELNTGFFHVRKSVKHLKNSQQKTTQCVMIILTPIERETLSNILLKKTLAQICRGLPLGSSSITAAVALVDCDMLTRVWDEMDYLIDVCRITKGAHIGHLGNM
jgi:hypothetical protein